MNNVWGNLVKLGLVTTAIVVGSLYFLFDGFVDKIAFETLSNWMKVEEAAILEGNLLNTVTKNQRAVHSSEFLKGFMLADFSKQGQVEQIAFGDYIDPKFIERQIPNNSNIRIVRDGLFKKFAIARIPNSPSKVIIFSFWSENIYEIFVWSCILFFAVISFFGYLLATAKRKENQKAIQYAEKAARVAHDIRSPLVQLSASIEKLEDVTIKNQLIDVSQRIREITKDLILNRNKGIQKVQSAPNNVISLGESIDSMIRSKSDLYPNIRFHLSCSKLTIPIAYDHSDLLRSLSNIIENSVEASEENGLVEVLINETNENLRVLIKDNGKGIPEHILPSIGTKGLTHGKKNGSGLGIYYAQIGLAMAGGSFKIVSKQGFGTSVTLEIPFKKTRALSNRKVHIEKDNVLVVVDDDSLVHKTWQQIFEENRLDQELDIRYFSRISDLMNSKLNLNKAFILTDFDLNEKNDGLDLVSLLKANDRALLVTGRADDPSVQAKALELGGVPVLSKSDLSTLQIVIA